MNRLLAGLFILVAVGPGVLRAQDPAMSHAFELERRGNYAAAAQAYRAVLRGRPGDPAALLGLERALLPLGRNPEILPQVQGGARRESLERRDIRRRAPRVGGRGPARQPPRHGRAVGGRVSRRRDAVSRMGCRRARPA